MLHSVVNITGVISAVWQLSLGFSRNFTHRSAQIFFGPLVACETHVLCRRMASPERHPVIDGFSLSWNRIFLFLYGDSQFSPLAVVQAAFVQRQVDLH